MFSFFHNTFWSRIVSFLTALVFSFSCLPANAQSIVPVTFSSFLIHPPYLKQLSERPTLYVIQDAHDSLEAQTGIRNILRELAAQDKIDTVLFEGGSRALARAFYDFDPDQKINQAIWDELFSQGALSGVERYGLEAPQKIDFVGVEDAETYLDDVQALADLFVRREKFEPAIRKENHKFKRLLEKQIPAPLKKILNQQDAFKDGRTSLEGRVRFLARNAETRLNLRLKEAQNQIHWPQLARFLKVLELEPAIHSAAIPAKLAQFRKRSLADSRLASLSFLWNANEHFRASGHVRWYFEEWIERAGNVPDAALYPWISYHVLKDELSPKALTEEVARLEELLIQNLAPSTATRKAIRSIREWERTKRLLRGELTREDWHEISASQRISRRFPSAVRHYRLAARRDKIIARNALRYFKAHPGRPAALVIGGFHTEAVTRALKSRDISFQLITPAISGQTQKIDYSSFFLPVLRTKHSTAKPHLGALPQNDKRVQVLRDEFHRLVNSLKVLGAESLGRKKALPDPENWPEEGDLGRLRQFFMWKKAELKKLGLKGAELEEALYENKRQLHGRLGGRAEHSDAVQGGKRAVFLRGMASKATEIGFQDMPTEEEVREAFKVLEAKQAVTLRKPKHKPVEYEPSINWEEKLLEAAEAVDGDQKGTEVLRNILEAACGKGDGRISTSDLQRRTSLKSENLKSLLEKLRDAGQVLVEENGEGASVRWAPLSTNGDTKARRAAIDAFLLNVLAPKEVVTSAPPSEIKDAEADTKAELAEPPPGPSPKAVPEIEFVTSVRVREAALGLETALNAKITEAQTRLEADEELNEKWIASIRSRITREIISGITERELEKRRKKILEKIDGGKYCQFQKTGLPETPATPSKDLSIDSKTFASKSPAQAQDYQLWLDSVWAVVLGMIRSVEQFAQEDEEVKAVAILIYRELEALRGRYASIPDILSLEKKMSRHRSRLNRLLSVFRNDLDPKNAAFVDDVNKTYDADTQAFEAMLALLDMLLLFGREHITVSHIISRGGLENYWELCRIFIDSILNKNKGEKSQSASLRTIGALFYVKERHILGDPEEIGAI
ncbi:MAG: hypothetical protein HY586_06310, partial [Candidatus Omnitrophica bacterium]|nr:hypothetical protein [Candidatus Omnitrophota bacterium]